MLSNITRGQHIWCAWEQAAKEQQLESNQNADQQQIQAFPCIVIHEVQSNQSIQDQNLSENIQKQPTVTKFTDLQTIQMENPSSTIQNDESLNSFSEDKSQGRNDQVQIFVHQVNSDENLPQNIKYTENTQILQSKSPKIEQQAKNQYEQQIVAKLYKRQVSEQYDYYVQVLQEKWAKRNQNTQKLKQTQDINVLAPKKQDSNQAHIFNVKKIKDQQLICSTQGLRNTKSSQDQRTIKTAKHNLNQLLNPNRPKKQSRYLKRRGRKHLSNFQSVNKSQQKGQQKSKQKSPTKSKQNFTDIFYEISVNKSVEMMSHILEDRYYDYKDIGDDKISQLQPLTAVNKIRKIIKRSPYGFLQIEVKDNKKSPKITNLRILKPKQMLRLKKTKHAQQNKQNTKCQQRLNYCQQKVSQNLKKSSSTCPTQLPFITMSK